MTLHTNNYKSSNIFQEQSHMLNEPCMPAVTHLVAEGRSLIDSERRAVLMVLEVLILWALMGIRAPVFRARVLPVHPFLLSAGNPGCSVRCDSMIPPVSAGTAGESRALLHA